MTAAHNKLAGLRVELPPAFGRPQGQHLDAGQRKTPAKRPVFWICHDIRLMSQARSHRSGAASHTPARQRLPSRKQAMILGKSQTKGSSGASPQFPSEPPSKSAILISKLVAFAVLCASSNGSILVCIFKQALTLASASSESQSMAVQNALHSPLSFQSNSTPQKNSSCAVFASGSNPSGIVCA
ncbi:hypothetical protein SAMN05444414_10440 [Roseovarius marisflavi]|uniref:Uncharacterized protein n=1 Tax=Roseovarius marisflavi TaxID=1054996 RepID=A0A1M6XCN7_9RHOB|nr:hypothetical protein SAMN05444414_10440 [Roseovarius marisflavi]